VQRAQHGFLRDVFRERQIMYTQQSHQRAMQTSSLVTEKMFHQLGRLGGRCRCRRNRAVTGII